jgi:hypothetical protein
MATTSPPPSGSPTQVRTTPSTPPASATSTISQMAHPLGMFTKSTTRTATTGQMVELIDHSMQLLLVEVGRVQEKIGILILLQETF